MLAPVSDPLTKARNIPLSRLAKEPFLVREPGSGTRAAVERLFASKKVVPKVRMELGSNGAIKQAVVGGLGISVRSRHTLSLDASMKHIAILDVENFPIRRHWYVAYPCGKKLAVIAQAFLEYLKQAPSLTPL